MRPVTRFGALAVAAALGLGITSAATPASAATAAQATAGGSHAVFVQTDDPAGNHVVAYHRIAGGGLVLAGTYATGGAGGILDGAVVDHLASQGSIAYDGPHALLLVTNAGSNTVSVFAVDGDQLRLRQIVRSGGDFPVSIAVHGNAVYVLNARDGGAVQGYVIAAGRLFPVAGWHRALGLDPTATPEFTHTPGQVAVSPDGRWLLVTTKANTSAVDVFRLGPFGRPAGSPVVTVVPGAVPFALTFRPHGVVAVAEAGTNAVDTFAIHQNGTMAPLHSAPTGQAATCWIVAAGPVLYASNAGSATLTGLRASAGGSLTVLGQTSTDAGTVDAAVTADSRYLYVQTGAIGTVDEFRVHANGSLGLIGSVLVPASAGAEGIVAI
jgi:6-phosphogluconolactonase (cycloisomerase 2 family)